MHSITNFIIATARGLVRGMLRCLLRLRYRLEVSGLEALSASQSTGTTRAQSTGKRPLLILPSHVALVDPLILHTLLGDWNPRPLADARQVERPVIRQLVKLARPIIIPDVTRDASGRKDAVQAVRQGMALTAQALAQGDSVLLFPAGRLTRDGHEHLGSNSGAYTLYAAQAGQERPCRVVLVRLRGLWGSSFSCAHKQGQTPLFFSILLRNVGRLLCNGLFFMPRRRVSVHFEEVTLPAPKAGVLAFNKALEDFYEAEPQTLTPTPQYFWQRGADAAALAALQATAAANSSDGHPDSTAQWEQARREHPDTAAQVLAILREEAGLPDMTGMTGMTGTAGNAAGDTGDAQAVRGAAPDLSLHSVLATDLGLDSLRLTAVALRLESLHHKSIQRLDLLTTAGDCLLAALGLLEGAQGSDRVPEAPDFWQQHSAEANTALTLPPAQAGESIPALFWRQVRAAPHKPCVAAVAVDGGKATVLTRRQALTRALALAAYFRTAPATRKAQRLGIMLPASPAATLTWLAVMLAGKEPVFCNWTTGEANFRHCLTLAQVPCVLTARALLTRLQGQGFDPATSSPPGTTWLCLEDVAPQLTLRHKLAAALGTVGNALGLPPAALRQVPDTAAILFTSGSETQPKGVPLSQGNVLANCRDVAQVLGLRRNDSLLGLLPPFHSLGLTGNMAVALAMGVPTVFHANPTESGILCAITRGWRPSLTVAPPTFVDGMLQKSEDGDLASLRLGFVGAEKCPLAVYTAFAKATGGGQLCEGYGVTECAPVVCVNRTTDIRPGTIGAALPSVQVAVVVEEEGQPLRLAAAGERGMLLVRGPNVFGGYLKPPVAVSVTASKTHAMTATTTQPSTASPALTASPASPFIQWQGQDWYRSGDLVIADAGGHMTFAGRLGRFVKIGGEMVSLPQMESVLLAAFEARRGSVEGPLLAVECPKVATADTSDTSGAMGATPELTLFCAVDISREEANAALREAGLSALYSLRAVRRMEALPLLGSGKTDYRTLARLGTAKV